MKLYYSEIGITEEFKYELYMLCLILELLIEMISFAMVIFFYDTIMKFVKILQTEYEINICKARFAVLSFSMYWFLD